MSWEATSLQCGSAGQIELYTHLPVMKQLVEQLQQWEFRVCGVFLVDSQFMVETFKVILCLFLSHLSNMTLQASYHLVCSHTHALQT